MATVGRYLPEYTSHFAQIKLPQRITRKKNFALLFKVTTNSIVENFVKLMSI